MAKKRPNILHLFTDQQRFDTIAALGNPIIRTPNLDRLVREGVVFERAYTPSPECVPARASMITGWYPNRTGCQYNGQPMPEVPTFMERLTDAGYRTHGVGKCHFTPDPNALRGFQTRDTQEEIVGDRTKDNYATWLIENGFEWVLEPHGVRGEMYYVPQPSPLPEAAHPTRWVGDRCLDFLKSASTENDRQPWYLYASFIHPHPPFAPPIPWHKLYRAPDMPLPHIPAHAEDLLFYINHFQNRYKYRDRGLDLNLIRCMRAYYYACISFIDAQIGRLLDALEESGELENTLILFSADHGEYLGDFGCFGKRGFHDVSARLPLLVRQPGGQDAGTHCEEPVSLVDLAPTFLQAAKIEYDPEECDGVSLLDIHHKRVERPFVYGQFHEAGEALYAAFSKEGKYVYSAADQREYLFDPGHNPDETTDFAGLPHHEEKLCGLREACQNWVRTQPNVAAEALDGEDWNTYPQLQMPANPDAGLIFQDPPWWDGQIS